MSSTLGCLGLGVADEAGMADLVERTVPSAVLVASSGDLEGLRWTDPSGASLSFALRGGSILDLVPSYAGPTTDAHLGGLVAHGAYVAADVLQDGELATRIAADLAQVLLSGTPEVVEAGITALGIDVTTHADAEAFAASPASVLGEPQEGKDPTRFAAESLLPYGLFRSGDGADPVAFVAGTVLSSETRTNELTGAPFHVARLRTVGFTATLCLDAADHPQRPEPGNVVAGSCYLVVDVPALVTAPAAAPAPPPSRRRRWRR